MTLKPRDMRRKINSSLQGASEPEYGLIDRIRDLLEGERLENALRLFHEPHPVDQGDVLVDLPTESRQELLSGLPTESTADRTHYATP